MYLITNSSVNIRLTVLQRTGKTSAFTVKYVQVQMDITKKGNEKKYLTPSS